MPKGIKGWRRKRGVEPRNGNPHQLMPFNSAALMPYPAERQEDCWECWAAQFICPYCGPCTDGMVMTTKCCLRCGNGLIRSSGTRCLAHAKKED